MGRFQAFKQLSIVQMCATCGQEFIPSSRHFLCSRCRAWNLCECGAPKMRQSKLCDECTPRSGVLNGQWRGGRYRNQKGYVLRCVRGHPRTWKSGNYVFEHILVMEDFLGRHLQPDENVHHLNGVKDDNRIDNLELWVRPQPAGIRAADALDWARVIIARYGEEDLNISNNAPIG